MNIIESEWHHSMGSLMNVAPPGPKTNGDHLRRGRVGCVALLA